MSLAIPPILLRELAGEPVLRANEVLVSHFTPKRSKARPNYLPGSAAPRREVQTAGNQRQRTGNVVRPEGSGESGDTAADEAYEASGALFDLFLDEYGWNSFDGEGAPLTSVVHFGLRYENAFWSPAGRVAVLGDGDAKDINRLTSALDLVAHEFVHGTVRCTAGLDSFGEPAALDESLADVFGVLAKQRRDGVAAAAASWVVGEGVLLRPTSGVGIRSLSAPGTAYKLDDSLRSDRQVKTCKQFRSVADRFSEEDQRYVRAGIPSHAFYLAAIEIGGNAWEAAGKIWFRAMLRSRHNTSFAEFGQSTVSIARELFGRREALAMLGAWNVVGVTLRGARI